MRSRALPSLVFLTGAGLWLALAATRPGIGQAPPPQPPAVVESDVKAVLPNGREIHPAGGWISLAPYPFAIALKRDGSEAAIPSIGFPFALNVIGQPGAGDPAATTAKRMPDSAEKAPQIETHAGLAYSPDGSLLYVATGNSGKIAIYTTADWKRVGEIALDGAAGGAREFKGSFAATVLVSASGRWLYALDQGNWRIVILDAERRKPVASVDTGAYPFGIALSPGEKRLYVTNSGLFEYTLVEGVKADALEATGLHFAPFGYPSEAARKGRIAEGKHVPGLGDENSTRGSSVWTYTVEQPARPALTAKLRLGEKIAGQEIGGAAPTGVAADADAAYVSLAHQDSVIKVSADGTHILGEIALSPFTGKRFLDAEGKPLRGVMPSGLALREGRLYVAESGIAAVAVVDTASMQLVEHIPTGWNPSAVTLSPDGQILYVVNTKGRGTGANGGATHGANSPSYIGALEYGGLSIIRLSMLAPAASLTASVIAANSAAIDKAPALPRLKHCFLVIRENRTFDEILGDLPGVNGDVTLARYGVNGWADENKAATHLQVTPNLHAMATQFATSDNFYVDSDVSADGHRWIMGINPTAYFNTAWTSNYGGRRSSSPAAAEPGRRALFGGNDAPMPEDEPQFGSLWEHVANSGKGILNYGEGLEVEGGDEIQGLLPEGQRLVLNAPLPKPVFEFSDRRYPTFNLGIPDQYRATEFERDMRRRMAQNKIPALIVIRLPNDHTAEPRAADGYPYRASYVADNDLALGRMVEFLSHTSLWKDSAMFITEDDAQGGVDHVDAHRSVLVIASPRVRPGAISHQHTSMGSITRTIDELLGLGAMNLEDALAAEITGVFATPADAAHAEPAFVVRNADPRVFVAARAHEAHPRTKAESAALRDMDDPDDIRPQVEKSVHRRVDKD